jgi:RNA polymerase sigma-70 factor (ECF subfamily)
MDGSVAFVIVLLATAPGGDLDAEELARRIRDGDREAFRAFFERHHGRLLGYVRSRGVPAEAAEDLVQNAFLYVWQHRDRIAPSQSLRAYLFRIGYTRALNHLRDTDRIAGGVDPQDAAARQPDWASADTPETDAFNAELRRQIDAAVAALPERRRAVFELCFLEGLTYREAADALDVTRKTVENHMRLALQDLREALEEVR